MKTSEDKLNEALRDVLKRKFDDYEEQPNPNALDRIRARVKPARTGRYWWLTGAFVLLFVSGIVLRHYLAESRSSLDKPASPAHAVNTRHAESASPHVETVLEKPAARAKTVSENNLVEDLVDQPASKPHPLHTRTVPAATVNAHGTLPSVDAGAPVVISDGAYRNVEEMPGGGNPASNDNLQAALAEEAAVPADSAAWVALPLEELAALPLSEMQVPLHLRGVVAPAYKPAKTIVNNPPRIAWLFNASALHSYQILTVPSSAAKDFQNFSFPSLFTAKSMGLKLSGGIERKGIQVQLHFSSFRQTYSYEVATDSYLVKPDDKGQYQTVRQGDRREENRKFSTLGIGIARQIRWGHSPASRFFAAVGAEYSHDLHSSQSLGWVSLGLGKQFAVSRHTAFSIGPYVEFSPVKVKGIENPFYYQPYRVGISAGLRFVRP